MKEGEIQSDPLKGFSNMLFEMFNQGLFMPHMGGTLARQPSYR